GSTGVANEETKDVSTNESERRKKVLAANSMKGFPNPFHTQTTIEYVLMTDTEISIEVYNLTGQKVRTIVQNQLQTKGTHRVDFNAEDLPDGIYYCSSITGAENVQTIKLVLNR
ncbi:MAG: T9SS type A sorting domain-containing protein, partial [Saprospiraceae bacterium]